MNISNASNRWRTRSEAPRAHSERDATEDGHNSRGRPEAMAVTPRQATSVPARPSSASKQKLSKKQREQLFDLQRAWQRLAVNILASNAERVPWVMGVGSAIRGEGRTTAALGISHAIARETGSQVALLELDLENPSIAEEFQPGATPGLVQFLRDECDFDQTFRSGADGKIILIPGSTGWHETPVAPTLDDLAVRLRHRIPEIVRDLKDRFKYTVVDLPPVLSNMQTERIATSLNGTLMVVRSGVTPVNLIQESVDLIGSENLLGVVQVGTPSPVPAWISNLISG